MTEEPYRWLEAIQNRREYIEDQLTPGQPVVALSAEPGVLLLGVKSSTPKLFEIYDHLALGAIGHPADIERGAPDRDRCGPCRRLCAFGPGRQRATAGELQSRPRAEGGV